MRTRELNDKRIVFKKILFWKRIINLIIEQKHRFSYVKDDKKICNWLYREKNIFILQFYYIIKSWKADDTIVELTFAIIPLNKREKPNIFVS